MSRDDPPRPNAYDPDDPRLTAYVLGELAALDGADRAVVEHWLETSVEARVAADELGDLAVLLEAELARETGALLPIGAAAGTIARPTLAASATGPAPGSAGIGSSGSRRGMAGLFAALGSVLALGLLACLVPGGASPLEGKAPGVVVHDAYGLAGDPGTGDDLGTGVAATSNFGTSGGRAGFGAEEGRFVRVDDHADGVALAAVDNDFVTFRRPPRLSWLGTTVEFDAYDSESAGFSSGDFDYDGLVLNGVANHWFDLRLPTTGESLAVAGDGTALWSVANPSAWSRNSGRGWDGEAGSGIHEPSSGAVNGGVSYGNVEGQAHLAMSNSIASGYARGEPRHENGRWVLDRLLAESEFGEAEFRAAIAPAEGSVERWGIRDGSESAALNRVHSYFFLPSPLDRAAGIEAAQSAFEPAFVAPRTAPLSTFDVDVSIRSYVAVQQSLARGRLPAAEEVRIGQLVNAVDLGLPEPAEGEAVGCVLEAGPCPWNEQNRLVLVGLRARSASPATRPPQNTVFAVDVSGSMRDPRRLPVVQRELVEFAKRTRPEDRLAIVAFNDDAHVVLDTARGGEGERVEQVVQGLVAGGGTNTRLGLELARENGSRYFDPAAANRVVLLTDGAGSGGPPPAPHDARLPITVVAIDSNGLAFSNTWRYDPAPEAGPAAASPEGTATEPALVDRLSRTTPVATGVTATVEFNPAHVLAYRRLGREDATGDATGTSTNPVLAGIVPKTAGGAGGAGPPAEPGWEFGRPSLADPVVANPVEANAPAEPSTLAAGESFAVLYEFVPRRDEEDEAIVAGPVLRFQQLAPPAGDPVRDELLAVRLKYVDDLAGPVVRDFTLPAEERETTSPAFGRAVAAATYGMALTSDAAPGGDAGLDLAVELALDAREPDPLGRQRRFVETVLNTRHLANWRSGVALPPPAPLPADEAMQRASIDGKYGDLIETIDVPHDYWAYGFFHDWGHWAGTSYAGRGDLPKAHWVYVYPSWYLWGERKDVPAAQPTSLPEPREEQP